MIGTVVLMIIAWLTAIYLEQYQHRNERLCMKQACDTVDVCTTDKCRLVAKNTPQERIFCTQDTICDRDAYDRCMESLSSKE